MCWDGDGGGGRFIAEFEIINNRDRKITLNQFLIYEGTEVRSKGNTAMYGGFFTSVLRIFRFFCAKKFLFGFYNFLFFLFF